LPRQPSPALFEVLQGKERHDSIGHAYLVDINDQADFVEFTVHA